VIELHPDAHGKPAVIGNCQAGWQIMMTAAVWPELFGPIILAGTPCRTGPAGRQEPMRYGGGLTGGSWLTALASDIGAGKFDGAWLVQNFENLNPANTLWEKKYHVYANVDTEGPRLLAFEKYWGGHVFLNDVEMQYIVDNLFIGNKLSTAELVTSDGVRIDLRNIARRSWCSAPTATTSRRRRRRWAGSPTCTAATTSAGP
jgi:poly(3-hydroxyalkanoate) synthetase